MVNVDVKQDKLKWGVSLEIELAELYDPLTMPPELITAHQHNDKAVKLVNDFSKIQKIY